MKLTATILFGLVVCLAAVNGKKLSRRSVEYNDHYEKYPTEPPQQEHPGPVEEQPEPVEEQPGPDEEQPGPVEEKPGPEPGEETGGEGGEEAGGPVEPPKKHPKETMAGDTDAEKHKGYCHWNIGVWFKPGVSQRCSCMKCDCKKGGVWDCNYNFAYCPYFYCGNVIFNPHTQICCCGKVHEKRATHACCGYYYYDKRHSKCCNYYSVRPTKSHCPRDRV